MANQHPVSNGWKPRNPPAARALEIALDIEADLHTFNQSLGANIKRLQQEAGHLDDLNLPDRLRKAA